MVTEEMGFKDLGYFPIFKEDTTLPFGEQYFTFSRSNWAGDLGTIMALLESGAFSQQEIQALASQYLEPIPTDMDEKFSLPVQVGRIRKMPMQLVAGMMEGLQDISSQPEAPSADLQGLIFFNLGLEYTKREPMVGETLGLVDTKNTTISDYIKASQNSLLSVIIMINAGNLLSAIDFLDISYFYYIPDTKGTVQIGGDLHSSYYETADSVMFNANNINLDISSIATKEYKTDNSNYFVDDGVLYTKAKSIGKYPSLKQGGRYDILEGTTKIENKTK